MDGVEEITRGWWRPTAGSIYPLLSEMSESGLVEKIEGGRYQLTERGRAHVESSFGHRRRRPRTLDEMLAQVENTVSFVEDLNNTNKADFEPHLSRIRNITKRLVELVGEEGQRNEKEAAPSN